MHKPFLVRWGTQDIMMAAEVLQSNEYDLPEHFDPNDRIIDIGANIGAFAYACLQRGCRVVECYEPEAENFELLTTNLADEIDSCRVRSKMTPVWSTTRKLNLVKKTDPHMTAMHYMSIPNGGPPFAPLAIWSLSIDLVLLRREDPIRLLKLDCEGSEVPILQGATTMDHVQEIKGELHYKMQMPGFPEPTNGWLEHRLKALGFKDICFKPNPHCPDLLTLFRGTR